MNPNHWLTRSLATCAAATLAWFGTAVPAQAETPTPEPSVTSATPNPPVTATASPGPAPTRTASPSVPVATPTEAEVTGTPTPSPAAAEAVTNLPTLSINLTPGYTLEQIHAKKSFTVPQDPETEPLNSATIVDPRDQVNNITADVEEIKGRGNFTWTLDKKPYQIKFASKLSVLGMPSAKTWVLLANHADASLMRNKVAFELAKEFGLSYTPESRFVDLVINGEYLGNYLLAEKVEVKANRVELTDPQGVLVELDAYGEAEDHWFRTGTTRSIVTLKDAVGDIPDLPEQLPADTKAGWEDIKADLDRLDVLLAAPEPDWAAISALIDVDSFVRYYYLQDAMANFDVVWSSVYFYKNGVDDLIHAGPVWDFDAAVGNFSRLAYGGDPTQEWAKNGDVLRQLGNPWFRHLYRTPGFVAATNAAYGAGLAAQVNALSSRVDAYAADIRESAHANFDRWPILGAPSLLGSGGHPLASTWEGEVGVLRGFVAARSSMLDGVNTPGQPILRYAAHVAELGWQLTHSSGQVVGTTGRGLPVEAVRFSVLGDQPAGALSLNAHVSEIGWMGYTSAGSVGTTGRGLKMEALQARLTGDLARFYDVEYRTHVADVGWQPWVTNGETAGTTGRNLGVEAVELRLVRKDVPTPLASIGYSAHVSEIGWMAQVGAGETAGTTGRALNVEALRATVSGVSGSIQYRAHVSEIGWMPWVSAPTAVGTTGRNLGMEALEIKLAGDLAMNHTVRYRAHVRDVGWQGWVTEGAQAGTTGRARPIEAVQIELVPKG